jgi:hypothetical protein
MPKQTTSKQTKTTPPSRVPDKDQYSAGGTRPRPQSPHADNPPKRQDALENSSEPKEDPDEHADAMKSAGKWKQEDTPPYARTYDHPLDEEGDPE